MPTFESVVRDDFGDFSVPYFFARLLLVAWAKFLVSTPELTFLATTGLNPR